jgi:hypothetical protein
MSELPLQSLQFPDDSPKVKGKVSEWLAKASLCGAPSCVPSSFLGHRDDGEGRG